LTFLELAGSGQVAIDTDDSLTLLEIDGLDIVGVIEGLRGLSKHLTILIVKDDLAGDLIILPSLLWVPNLDLSDLARLKHRNDGSVFVPFTGDDVGLPVLEDKVPPEGLGLIRQTNKLVVEAQWLWVMVGSLILRVEALSNVAGWDVLIAHPNWLTDHDLVSVDVNLGDLIRAHRHHLVDLGVEDVELLLDLDDLLLLLHDLGLGVLPNLLADGAAGVLNLALDGHVPPVVDQLLGLHDLGADLGLEVLQQGLPVGLELPLDLKLVVLAALGALGASVQELTVGLLGLSEREAVGSILVLFDSRLGDLGVPVLELAALGSQVLCRLVHSVNSQGSGVSDNR